MIDQIHVENIVTSDELDWRIVRAREMNTKLLLHVEGVGLDEYLSRINNYENEGQHQARQKHAISNKFITEQLLRPVDNAFNAKGGSSHFTFSANQDKLEKKIKDRFSKVKHGTSLYGYIKNYWFNKYVIDPNGLIFIEVEDDDEEPEAYLTYKSIQNIRAYEQSGQNVDWVVFEPHEVYEDEDKGDSCKFWVVDESNYYLYLKNDEGVELIDIKEHDFGMVPAIVCSDIIDNITGWKKSPIDSQIELLDKYVTSNSVLTITEFFYLYPEKWQYVDDCNECNGEGFTVVTGRGGQDKTECGSCGGTGKFTRKDVTDILELTIPNGDEQRLDPAAGYIYMPTEPWKMQIDSVDRYWNLIFFSQWNTTIEKDSSNETATGRFVDAQFVHNRLNHYSSSIETAHTLIANILGRFYFPEFESCIYQYGRRYMVETPDQIWDKYLKSKEKNAPVSILNLLLYQFIESEFRENISMLNYELKKAKIEPFVHWDIDTVRSSTTISVLDKAKKEYYNEWLNELDETYFMATDDKKLKEELTRFVEPKINNNEVQ